MYSRFEFPLHGALGAVSYLFTLPILFVARLFGYWAPIYPAICDEDMSNQVAIVTGSNCGVGFETARNFASRGALVILACRDPVKGHAAAAQINDDVKRFGVRKKGVAEFLPLDLENFSSIENFVNLYKSKYSGLDILVNNGGINTSGVTSYGLQQTFCTNYLGHYYLFRLLCPMMLSSSNGKKCLKETGCLGARVVNLSSVMHHVGSSDFLSSAYFGTRVGDSPMDNNTYSDSKLYMNYLTMEINRRYAFPPYCSQRPITAVSVNPGAVRSNIWRAVPWPMSIPYDLLMRVLYLTTEQGASSSIFAASVPYNELFASSDVSNADGEVAEPSLKHRASQAWGKFCGHVMLPYVTPYRCSFYGSHAGQRVPAGLVNGSFCLAFECLGAFWGPSWSRASLPPHGDKIAEELWEFSENLLEQKIGHVLP